MNKTKETLFNKLRTESIASSYSAIKGNRHNLRIKFLILFIAVIICTFFFSVHINKENYEISELGLDVGMAWTNKTLEAEFSFPVYKSIDAQQLDIAEAVLKVLPVFNFDESVPYKASQQLNFLIEDYLEKTNIINDSILDLLSIKSTKLSESGKIEVKKRELKKIQKAIQNFFDKVYRAGFVDVLTENIRRSEIAARISNNEELLFPSQNLSDSSNIIEKAEKYFQKQLQDGYESFAMQ